MQDFRGKYFQICFMIGLVTLNFRVFLSLIFSEFHESIENVSLYIVCYNVLMREYHWKVLSISLGQVSNVSTADGCSVFSLTLYEGLV